MKTLPDTLAGRVRPAFPALERIIAGHPVAYFDGPGGTQVPQRVVTAMSTYLFHQNANDGWAYRTSVETDAALRHARQTAAAFVNAASADEIVFGANMTTLTFHIARAIGRSLKPGDEIIVTDLDHHANIDPWIALERDYGAVIKRIPLLENTPQLDIRAYEQLLNARTRLVAVGLSSNAFGTINPVAAIARAAHRVGALVFVDAVHAAAHAPIDVTELDADMLAFSAYKVYGPHVGVVYCRDALMERLPFVRLAPQTPKGSRRVESGTLNHEGIVGTGAALEFLADCSSGAFRPALLATLERLGREESAVFEMLVGGLRALDRVRVYEPAPDTPRHPTVAFSVTGCPANEVAARLSDDHALFVSHGDFYAATAVAQIAPSLTKSGGVVRAGLSIYSTSDEVERLVSAVAKLSASN